MDSSRLWWKRSRMPTRKLMDHPMLRPEHYFSYVTPQFWLNFHPEMRYIMDALHKEQFFQDHQNLSTYIRFGRNSSKFRISRRKTLTKPTELRIYKFSRLRSKYSSSLTNKGQAPCPGQLVQWLKSWIVDILTWSRPPMAKSTGEIEPIWSPYAMMDLHFKTIQWKRRRNSLKTIPVKTISPPRWNLSFQKDTCYMDVRSMLFDEPDIPPSPPWHYSPRSVISTPHHH